MSQFEAKPEIPHRFHNVVMLWGKPWSPPQPQQDESKLIRKLKAAREGAELFAWRRGGHRHVSPEVYGASVCDLIDCALALVRKLEKKAAKKKR